MHIYDHFRRIIKAVPAPLCVLECGACDGSDTVKLHDTLSASGKVFEMFAVEPVLRNFETLRCRVYGKPNLHLIHAAIGQISGMVDFWDSVTPEYYGSSSIRPPKESLRLWPTMRFEKNQVACLTLDSLIGHRDHIDFIWADTQGAEIDLILGGPQTLAKTRYLYTEFSDKELYEGEILLPEILERLPDFEIVECYDHDVLLKNMRLASA